MKRWMTHLTIAAYIGVLAWGVFSHTVNFKTAVHPAMYFIVWDMFCGWSAYEARTHIIGEGESGACYELAPGPWGGVYPFGDLERQHYDSFASHVYRQAENCLKHTRHEPIVRIHVVEETWAKKYNLPDYVWDLTYNEPKDPHSYYNTRMVLAPDGTTLKMNPTWFNRQYMMMLADNPRLREDAHRGKPFFAFDASNLAPQVGRGLGPRPTVPSAH